MPDDEVLLTPEAAGVANEIRQVDADLADNQQRTESTVGWGMRGAYSWSGGPHEAERRLDAERRDLLDRRAELVARLKALTGVE